MASSYMIVRAMVPLYMILRAKDLWLHTHQYNRWSVLVVMDTVRREGHNDRGFNPGQASLHFTYLGKVMNLIVLHLAMGKWLDRRDSSTMLW